MKKDTILETDYATLWYYPDNKIVHHQFHKFIHGDRFREVLSKGLEIVETDGAQKWLSDDRNNSTLTAADSAWAVDVWTPRVMAAGWKYWAIVLPDKVVGKMNMQRYIEMNAELGVTIDIFDDADEALQWLESV
ncbi:MAG: hypothetical protein KC547_09655 [Anaerolineae bacterium]|nr:hypothetical protein [Anaerolineae bacterium]MCA9907719.1 hypothetical protein [Anaerolineae bacterium]